MHVQNWTDLKQPPPPLKPDVYVSWAKIYTQEHLLDHNTVFRNLYHILFPLHPFIPFLTPHPILQLKNTQMLIIRYHYSHLYIAITHCIFTIPNFLIIVLFQLLLRCYTVLVYTRIKLINGIMLAIPGIIAFQC